jgi:hypothetical protein
MWLGISGKRVLRELHLTAALVGLLAGGCGDDGDGSSPTPAPGPAGQTGGRGGSGPAGGGTGGGSAGTGGSSSAGGTGGSVGGQGGSGGSGDARVDARPADGRRPDAAGGVDSLPAASPPGGTVCINADGQSSEDGSDTYQLLERVFGTNSIEHPDGDHTPLFRHVKEESDPEVGNHFAVHVHKEDSDRGADNGKNRVEIKVHVGAADALKATDGEIITYTWRFKMDADMVYSPRFNAMFQIKSFGGNEGLPVLNIKVAPNGGSDRLILEYIGDAGGEVRALGTAPLTGAKGVWLEVFLRLEVKNSGSVFMTIKGPDGAPILQVDEKGLDTWRQGSYLRPKWGLYRGKSPNTRDLEIVRFANFGITPGPTPTSDCRNAL